MKITPYLYLLAVLTLFANILSPAAAVEASSSSVIPDTSNSSFPLPPAPSSKSFTVQEPSSENLHVAVVAADAKPITTRGAIGARYQSDGGESKASYGKPLDNETCGYILNSCFQNFERGTLVWSSSTGTHLLVGAIRDKWLAAGGMKSSYGIPSTDEISQDSGKGVEQLFTYSNKNDGGIYWTNRGTGANFVNFRGGIGSRWAVDGNFRDLTRYGFPTADEQCGFIYGACFQRFERGTLVWTPAYDTIPIGGGVRELGAIRGLEIWLWCTY